MFRGLKLYQSKILLLIILLFYLLNRGECALILDPVNIEPSFGYGIYTGTDKDIERWHYGLLFRIRIYKKFFLPVEIRYNEHIFPNNEDLWGWNAHIGIYPEFRIFKTKRAFFNINAGFTIFDYESFSYYGYSKRAEFYYDSYIRDYLRRSSDFTTHGAKLGTIFSFNLSRSIISILDIEYNFLIGTRKFVTKSDFEMWLEGTMVEGWYKTTYIKGIRHRFKVGLGIDIDLWKNFGIEVGGDFITTLGILRGFNKYSSEWGIGDKYLLGKLKLKIKF